MNDLINRLKQILNSQPVRTFSNLIPPVNAYNSINKLVQTPQVQQYFNPTSNGGQNFWSGPTAQKLGNIQERINYGFNPSPQQKQQQADLFRKSQADALQNNYFARATPQWATNIQSWANNYPATVAQNWQQKQQNQSTLLNLIQTPQKIRETAASYIPGLVTGTLLRSPEEEARITQVKATGTELDKARLNQELTQKGIESFAFGATSAPVEVGGMNPTLARNILNVKPNATELEINNATRDLLKTEYPRSLTDLANRNKTNAARMIAEARDVLVKAIQPAETRLITAGGIPLRSNEPPIVKRSELTGKQLSTTNEQLLHPETIPVNEDLGVAQRDYQLNKPSKEIMTARIKSYVERASKESSNTSLERLQNTIDPTFTPVVKKVNFIDYIRTPENVLNKIGLGSQAKYLRTQYESYLTKLPEEINTIKHWADQVPGKESSQRIFEYLDTGDLGNITPKELRVAEEVKTHLHEWANKLKLPVDKRISHYITHIFEMGASKAEFNDEIASLIDRSGVAGSVYDPFLEKRSGSGLPYIKDVWRALEAYIKRATRKFYMDPALELLKNESKGLEVSQVKYLERLTARINMRPTEIDTLIDNWLKSIPKVGYRFGQRPVAYISRGVRQMVYRGGIGLNVSSALRNLTQGVNTYAVLGEKYTLIGYLKAVKNWNSGELERVGVLRDSFVEDRTLSVFKNVMQKLDKGLFYLFENVEKLNRGSAYFGAKEKALKQGLNEEQAINVAKELVRKTQFVFGSIDTPVAMQSDLIKVLTQFQTYGVKQAEFMAGLLKNKNYAGIIRYIVATLALMKVFKDSFGMKLEIFPQFSLSPTVKLISGAFNYATASDTDKPQALRDMSKSAVIFAPAGIQIQKSVQGLQNYSKGESTAPSGAMRYPIPQDTSHLLKLGLFGQYSIPESQKYYDSGASVLGKNQSETVRNATDKINAYQQILNTRADNKVIDTAKTFVEQSGKSTMVNTNSGTHYIYLDDKGKSKVIDLSFQPTQPKLTGHVELDKLAVSEFNSQIKKRKDDIKELVNQGQLTADEGEKQLEDLTKIKLASSDSKIPKITNIKLARLPNIKFRNLKPIKIKRPPVMKPFRIAKIKRGTVRIKPYKLAKYTNTLSNVGVKFI